MNDSTIYAVITYLIIFRVSIILVGGVSIVLGYKLFVRGIFPSGSDEAGGSMVAKLAGYEISMKNAAPGTFFALFGSIVIGAMILSSPPQVKMEQQNSPPITIQQGDDAVNAGNTREAIVPFSSFTARGKNADAWHNEAWEFLDKSLNAAKKAANLAKNSQKSDELNSYLDTLAAISFVAEKDEQVRTKALEQMPDDADFRKKLEEFSRVEEL